MSRSLNRFGSLLLLWALGMAVQTLRRIRENPTFSGGDQVKITRNEVRAIVVATSALVRSDRALRWLFESAIARIPRPASAT